MYRLTTPNFKWVSNIMNLQHAINLIDKAVFAFKEVDDDAKKLKMAEAIVILLEVVPALLVDKIDTDSFAKFIEYINADIDKVRVFASYSTLQEALPPKANPICLKNDGYVDCGGPPSRQSRCDLCGKSGRL